MSLSRITRAVGLVAVVALLALPSRAAEAQKSPAVAGLLNGLVLPGVGNVYAGNSGHGLRHLGLHFVGVGILVVGLVRVFEDIPTTDADGLPTQPRRRDDVGSVGLVYAGAAVVTINWIWSIFTGISDANAANAGRMSFLPSLRPLAVTVAPTPDLPRTRTGLQLGQVRF